ncbi:hypothetical protein Cgig2_030403 [Carnegiea gigantea]|uniref:Uncharacterized protein n=1 Tax=Carnegiea gigantea TaxID=171969 RepID=A0A9Q1KKY7_9CARY|nr:hypothetical protein Cgig2_030403 [Carnegiea gigantea]
MIYRKWSLLSGTMALTGGVIGAVVIANLLFVKEVSLSPKPLDLTFPISSCFVIRFQSDPFLKPQPQNQMNAPSSNLWTMALDNLAFNAPSHIMHETIVTSVEGIAHVTRWASIADRLAPVAGLLPFLVQMKHRNQHLMLGRKRQTSGLYKNLNL